MSPHLKEHKQLSMDIFRLISIIILLYTIQKNKQTKKNIVCRMLTFPVIISNNPCKPWNSNDRVKFQCSYKPIQSADTPAVTKVQVRQERSEGYEVLTT